MRKNSGKPGPKTPSNMARKKAKHNKNPVILTLTVESEFERELYDWLYEYVKELGALSIRSFVIQLIMREQLRASKGE